MSDPQPARLKKKPPRAEPLQPDAPAQGDDQQPAGGPAPGGVPKGSAQRQKEQADTARDNVREGYD